MSRIGALFVLILIVGGGIAILCFYESWISSKNKKKYTKRTNCPCCGGTRFHAFVEEQVVSPAQVKSKTTLNMNPLKPFTVFNHKEKVVRQQVTRRVSKFVCDDCGNIFE